jgi:phosphoribosylamine--glycine ligase
MRILVIGGGGREHALVWKLAQSKQAEKIYVAPGNPGIAPLAECVPLDTANNELVVKWAQENKIDLVVVGPEVPLVAGLSDALRKVGLAVFGPSSAAAAIEGSKSFSKELMKKYNIPTAFFKVCTDLEEAKAFVREQGAPIVIKADGLAAGKGVVVAMKEKEALDALDEIMGNRKFGAAGSSVVIEEFMDGEEASLFAFTDGKTIVPMVAAQDHKRVNDEDRGPNTGGMGAYAPAPVLTEALKEKCMETIIRPTLAAMAKEGRPYSGCLYTGLMIKDDSAKVVEFNCRFGDPETQAVVPLLDGDLAEIMMACATGTLRPEMVRWSDKAAVCVVMASGGYPGNYQKGLPITGLQEANALQDVVVFHAGTKEVDGRIVTNGGRVLGVTAVGANIPQAKEKAYAAVNRIHFEQAHYRFDIAWRALKRLNNSH